MITLAKKLLASLSLAAAVATPAVAAPIFSTIGQTETFVFSHTFDGALLTAEIDFTLTALSSTTATLDVTVQNTTTTSQPGTNRLVSFAIDDIAPNITAVGTTNPAGTTNWTASLTTNFPGFQSVELCLWSGVNCSGGSNEGLGEQTSDSFTLALSGSFTGSLEFNAPFAVRYQSAGINDESVTFAGTTTTQVPVPGSLALFGLGVAALGVAVRRRPVPQS
jgi:hypothetical protein